MEKPSDNPPKVVDFSQARKARDSHTRAIEQIAREKLLLDVQEARDEYVELLRTVIPEKVRYFEGIDMAMFRIERDDGLWNEEKYLSWRKVQEQRELIESAPYRKVSLLKPLPSSSFQE